MDSTRTAPQRARDRPGGGLSARENPIIAIEFVDKLISVAETLIDYQRKS